MQVGAQAKDQLARDLFGHVLLEDSPVSKDEGNFCGSLLECLGGRVPRSLCKRFEQLGIAVVLKNAYGAVIWICDIYNMRQKSFWVRKQDEPSDAKRVEKCRPQG